MILRGNSIWKKAWGGGREFIIFKRLRWTQLTISVLIQLLL